MSRKDDRERRVALPRYGMYNCVFKYIIEAGLGCRCVMPPPITRRTMELGAANSPDTVCVPYKTLLGSMMEALEQGAEVLVMSSGLCRLGYFGELMEQTLRDMGYSFEFLNLQAYQTGHVRDLARALKKVAPHMKYARFAKAGYDALRMLEHVDEINDLYYRSCGFADDRAAYGEAYRAFFRDMEAARDHSQIEEGYRRAAEALTTLPVTKPAEPLRVGIVGEYYTVMDPPSNLFLEQKLADMGVEVHRWMDLSSTQLKRYGGKNLRVGVRDLCRYEMGPTSTANVWCARRWAQDGFDGLIHVKSAACTPETDVMPLLQQVSAETHVPVLYLSFDTQTSDVGLMTRLEAFYDMIAMRKKVV